MQAGDVVFLAMTSADRGGQAWVTRGTVISGEHRVILMPSGHARGVYAFETVHQTEREAWEACATELMAEADRIRAFAQECLRKAAAAEIVQVPA